MKIVVAIQDDGPVPGGTQPKRYAICHDEATYVVKRPDDPDGKKDGNHKGPSKEFFNEIFACILADKLGVNTPNCCIVDVPTKGILEGFQPGQYFGSLKMVGYDGMPPEFRIISISGTDELDAIYRLFHSILLY